MKHRGILFFVFGSALLESIALGRQKAWRESLNKWLCETPRPPMPGVVDSLLASGGIEWMLAIAPPAILGLIFISIASRWPIEIWFTVLALHLVIRFSAFAASSEPWGACGLRRDHVLTALLADIAFLVFAVAGAVVGGLAVFIIRRLRVYMK